MRHASHDLYIVPVYLPSGINNFRRRFSRYLICKVGPCAMNVGSEWLVEAEDCSAELLRDSDALRRVCDQIINDLDLRVVGDAAWHEFPEAGGVTGLFLLTESHLAFHTYPEYGIATFNLYCCKPRPAWPWRERLQEMLCAGRVTVRRLSRGPETSHNTEDVSSERSTIERKVGLR